HFRLPRTTEAAILCPEMASNLSPVLIGFLAQAAGAILLAAVLEAFHRHYRRDFLRHWAWSWWGFFIYLAGGILALFLTPRMEASGSPGCSPPRSPWPADS